MRLADLFRASDVSRMESLHWIARQAVEGLAVGRHRSPHKGSSVEFKEHRPYVPGDELKNIDWKAFGKSDRLYIREFEEETNLRCMLLVDQSGSMAYGGDRARSLSRETVDSSSVSSPAPASSWWNGTKQEYAAGLAAAMAYLMLSHQDSVGVMTFDSKVRDYVPPRMLPSHLNVILNSLVQERRGGETDLGTVLSRASVKLSRRGLVILISDGFGDVESLGRALTLLRGGRQDVVFLQVVDPDELDFPFHERIDFRDLERGDRHEIIDARQIRERYLESLTRHNAMIAAACRRNHVDHLLISTELPLVDCLSRFISMRQMGPVSGAASDAVPRRTVMEDTP